MNTDKRRFHIPFQAVSIGVHRWFCSHRMVELRKRLQTAKTDQELTALQRQIAAMDDEIDQFVYEPYELTDEEIAIVEESVKKSSLCRPLRGLFMGEKFVFPGFPRPRRGHPGPHSCRP